MLKIRWTRPASEDFESIFNYLLESHLSRARSTVVELRNSAQSLKRLPHKGRVGSEEGTRELLHERFPFILIYRITEEAIEILHIWHGAQKLEVTPKLLTSLVFGV